MGKGRAKGTYRCSRVRVCDQEKEEKEGKRVFLFFSLPIHHTSPERKEEGRYRLGGSGGGEGGGLTVRSDRRPLSESTDASSSSGAVSDSPLLPPFLREKGTLKGKKTVLLSAARGFCALMAEERERRRRRLTSTPLLHFPEDKPRFQIFL